MFQFQVFNVLRKKNYLLLHRRYRFFLQKITNYTLFQHVLQSRDGKLCLHLRVDPLCGRKTGC